MSTRHHRGALRSCKAELVTHRLSEAAKPKPRPAEAGYPHGSGAWRLPYECCRRKRKYVVGKSPFRWTTSECPYFGLARTSSNCRV